MRRSAVVIGSILVALLATVLAAPSAQAEPGKSPKVRAGEEITAQPMGLACDLYFSCGTVYSDPGSDRYINIVDNWPPEFGNVRGIAPGQVSTRWFRDTDGFWISPGCVGINIITPWLIYYSGWHKISDIATIRVRVDCLPT